jgi:hypothetical protein
VRCDLINGVHVIERKWKCVDLIKGVQLIEGVDVCVKLIKGVDDVCVVS